MLKKLTLGFVFAFMLSLSVFGVKAQDALKIGDSIKGELTAKNFAVEYTYEGKADEVLVIFLKLTEAFGDLSNPSIILKDAQGDQLLRYDGYSDINVVWLLPRDETYTIVVTRADDEAGTSVGEYSISVTNPEELTAGASVDRDLNSDQVQYFAYRGDSDFVLSYLRAGDFTPEFTINTIETDNEYFMGQLTPIAVVGGKLVTQGAVGVIPGGKVYIIKVGLSLSTFDYYNEPANTTYTLQIGEAQGN